MEHGFWYDSWDKGGFYTSFHRKDVHPFVQQHTPPERFAGSRVLVPLCGKTNDLLYYKDFAKQVIGVELVEKAIYQFFEENKLEFERQGDRFVSDNLTIICGDFFSLRPEDVGPIDLIYDRAALVALPLSMRLDYVRAVDRLSHPGTKQLVITLEYDPILESAPFSVAPEEVAAYYAYGYHIQHIEAPLLPNHGMVRRWKLRYLLEHGFLLEKHRDLPHEALDLSIHELMAKTIVVRNQRTSRLEIGA